MSDVPERWARLSAETVSATSEWWPYMEDGYTREEHIEQLMRSAVAYIAPVLADLRRQVEALRDDQWTLTLNTGEVLKDVLNLLDTGGSDG